MAYFPLDALDDGGVEPAERVDQAGSSAGDAA